MKKSDQNQSNQNQSDWNQSDWNQSNWNQNFLKSPRAPWSYFYTCFVKNTQINRNCQQHKQNSYINSQFFYTESKKDLFQKYSCISKKQKKTTVSKMLTNCTAKKITHQVFFIFVAFWTYICLLSYWTVLQQQHPSAPSITCSFAFCRWSCVSITTSFVVSTNFMFWQTAKRDVCVQKCTIP